MNNFFYAFRPQVRFKVIVIVFFFAIFTFSQAFAQISPPSSRLVEKRFAYDWRTAPYYGFLEYTPVSYETAPNGSLPLVIALHGIGKVGNGTTELYKLKEEGLTMLIANNDPIAYDNPFIVIAPQAPPTQEWFASIKNFISNIIIRYPKADPNRIYLTGLSYGGYATWKSGWESADKLAAIIPISQCGDVKPAQMTKIGIWAFDGDYTTCQTKIVNDINNLGGNAKHSQVTPAHNAWDIAYKSQATWDWLLAQRRVVEGNLPPTSNAGTDKTIALPTNSTTLTGTGTDSDGTIAAYSWTKQSGPSVTLGATNTSNLALSNLVEGVYTFRLTVTDDKGATSADDAVVTVIGANSNNSIRVNAGGTAISGTPGWISDNPQSSYVTASFSTIGGCANCLSLPNTTGAPDDVFKTNRQTTSSGGLHWDFDVANGTYTVNLYFAEFWSGGVRKFNIVIENTTREPNFDIKAAFGLNKAGKKTYDVTITDGHLDIDFFMVQNGVLISGIEIIPSTSSSSMRNSVQEPSLQASDETLYPNPVSDYVYLSIPGEDREAEISITNGVGKIYYSAKSILWDGKAEVNVSNLPQGIFFIKINSAHYKNKPIRFIKE